MIDPMSIDLPRFLTGWYGSPDLPAHRPIDIHSWLPEPLKDWYELSSQWTRPLMSIKRMRRPEEIALKDGKAVFMEDPGDQFWAFDPSSPMDVYEGELYEQPEKVAEQFPEFLIHNALNEAAYTGASRRACDQVEESRLLEILAPMTEVAFSGWRWPRPGHRIFVADCLVADVGPALEDHSPWGNRAGYANVQIGCSDPASLLYLDELHGLSWIQSAYMA
ncbi:hypothetical protein ACEZDB_17700 [Streptacidiphilus sp. N1-3]|uniref:Uncharacterized protein n=1 Tax=Streptacidiphilus alkalitolerans TaxID=3342712 RepID=A0ABV6X3B9_9ACTN